MKISKKDALMWFRFFASLPEEETILPAQQEIVYSVFTQIDRAERKRQEALKQQIPNLKTVSGRSLYVGPEAGFPKGCRSCLFGTGLGAIRKTNRCNAKCLFCYDYGHLNDQPPVGEGLWDIGGTRFYEEDLDLLFSIQKKPSGVCYVYLEPFCEIEKYYGIIRRFHEAGVYQHMYTNGIAANEENLRLLGEAGLDELRFNLGATSASDAVIDKMAIAKKYIPMVGVETPMTPDFFDRLMEKKQKIIDTGIDFINLAELHLNDNNIGNYEGASLYMSRCGYISPIWSRELTLKAMKTASEENWPVAVHDCSNETKFARDLNLKAKEGGWFGSSAWHSEFDAFPFAAFLPILEDESFSFVEEEEMPRGFGIGDIVL